MEQEWGKHPQTNKGTNPEHISNHKNMFSCVVENTVSTAKSVIPEIIDKAKKTYKEQIQKSQLREFDENE